MEHTMHGLRQRRQDHCHHNCAPELLCDPFTLACSAALLWSLKYTPVLGKDNPTPPRSAPMKAHCSSLCTPPGVVDRASSHSGGSTLRVKASLHHAMLDLHMAGQVPLQRELTGTVETLEGLAVRVQVQVAHQVVHPVEFLPAQLLETETGAQ